MGTKEFRCTVGDYVTLVRGTTYKGALVGKPGPALLGLGSIEPGGGFREGHYKTYGGDCPAKLMLFPGDLYVALKGATKDGSMVGSVARVPQTIPSGRLTQDTVKLEFQNPNSHEVDYIYWLLRTPQYRDYCANRVTGSAVAALSREDFLAYPVPPLTATRRQLVDLFDFLEDKIRVNQQMNQTLESIARALFKSWFIDFDPVRAKMDGRQPAGMDAETAALFPDEFEDSAIGRIPKGWRVVPLPEAIEVNPTRSLAKGKLALYLDMQNMPTQGHRPNGWIYREFGSGTKFVQGDTLLARITPCLENGKTAFVDFLPEGEVGWGSTEYIIFRPKSPLPNEFGYFLARSNELRTHAILNMTGSSGRQRVPANCFSSYLLTVPSDPIAQKFGEATVPSMRRIKANSEQTATLISIRDALLPKLLAGEIRTKEVEEVLELVL